jgi:hypothetical protein
MSLRTKVILSTFTDWLEIFFRFKFHWFMDRIWLRPSSFWQVRPILLPGSATVIRHYCERFGAPLASTCRADLNMSVVYLSWSTWLHIYHSPLERVPPISHQPALETSIPQITAHFLSLERLSQSVQSPKWLGSSCPVNPLRCSLSLYSDWMLQQPWEWIFSCW